MIGQTTTDDAPLPSADRDAPIMSAGRTIDQLYQRDNQYPDLADLLRVSTSQQYIKPETGLEEGFAKDRSVPIPFDVASLADDDLCCRWYVGFLPEIGRAWMSIDNRLYLWNYNGEDPDIYAYEDQDQIITSVTLVKPKRDIFGSHIQHLLIVTTAMAIITLGISVSNDPFKESVFLYATDIVVSSDNDRIVETHGTDEGRIFLLSASGMLYELEYTAPGNTWFQRNCRLVARNASNLSRFLPSVINYGAALRAKAIAVDRERKLLYNLRRDNSIELIKLGEKGDLFETVAVCTDAITSARHMCRTSAVMFDESDLTLETIHVISQSESKKVHLVAITTSGFRLYFTHNKSPSYATVPTAAQPNTIELVHVRLPPPPDAPGPMAQGYQPEVFGAVTKAYYNRGTFLAARISDTLTDSVVMTSINTNKQQAQKPQTGFSYGPQTMSLVENVSTDQFEGRVYAISEANLDKRKSRNMNELSEQLSDPPRQFLIHDSRKIVFYNKQRPVDILYELLLGVNGDVHTNQQPFTAFFERYGRDQACAMCLSIISGVYGDLSPQQSNVVRGATSLFFGFGGAPTVAAATAGGGNYLGQPMASTGTVFSGKHDGFALFIARLVSPIWKTKVFQTHFRDRLDLQSVMLNCQRSLSRLKQFMDANPSFHASPQITDSKFQTSDHGLFQVRLNEQQSLNGLYLFLVQSIEAIAFLDFLIDTRIEDIMQCVSEKVRKEMMELTLEDMLSTAHGRALSRELVVGAINRYGASHIHVGFDIVSDMLQRKCASLFTPSDVAFYRGYENLRRAQYADDQYERTTGLTKSLELFKQAAEYFTNEKLGEICTEYVKQGYHTGAVELPIERAQKLDPQQQSLHYLENGQTQGDPRKYFFDLRVECYDHIFVALENAKACETRERQGYTNRVLGVALGHKDRFFHYVLYNWLQRQNWIGELLAVDTDYLLPYLKKHVSPIESMELQWQYHRRREEYFEAALKLEQLALIEDSRIRLEDRITHLAQAVVNARCRDPRRVADQEASQLLQRLEKRVLLARKQYKLAQMLRSSRGEEGELAAQALEGGLLDEHALDERISSAQMDI